MRHRWVWAWALQITEMLAVGLIAAFTQGVSPVLHGAMLWGVAPAAGLVTACRAVLRGLNNYLAWLAPAACLFAANHLLWGYSPPAGPALLTALTSLTGAAAGQVLLERRKKNRSKHKGA